MLNFVFRIKGTKKFTPLVVILGEDIAKELKTLVEEIRLRSAEDSVVIFSMGQDQEEKAEFWFRKCVEKGLWIYFQVKIKMKYVIRLKLNM